MTRSTRRAFLRLVAAGSAALAAGAVAPLAHAAPAPAKRKRAATAAPVTPAIRREIASQKAYVARSLRVIRDHVLPAGSELAFTFRPLRPRRRRGAR